jgi:hypothetical protein
MSLTRGGCVKLEITSEPDPAAPAGAAGAAPPGADFRYHMRTTLVTDPRTLVPRSTTRVMDTTDPALARPGHADGSSAAERTSHVVETMTFRCK